MNHSWPSLNLRFLLILFAWVSHSNALPEKPVHSDCIVHVSGYSSAWINVRRSDSGEILHGELLGNLKSTKKSSTIRILPHLAISLDAYSRACKKPANKGSVYPEAYLFSLRSWELMASDSTAYVCKGNLNDCIDSTKQFDSQSSAYWKSIRTCNPLRLKLKHALDENYKMPEYLESLGITQKTADSALNAKCR